MFVTGIFSSSVICLIWQNVFRMKQEVQTNRAVLTKKPAGCEDWRREGCVETSQPLPGSEGAAGNLERDNSSGTGVTEQGEMGSN